MALGDYLALFRPSLARDPLRIFDA